MPERPSPRIAGNNNWRYPGVLALESLRPAAVTYRPFDASCYAQRKFSMRL
jgi:hypothetical protein